MIRYLLHNEIDKTKWDNCVSEAFNGIVYTHSWFLDIVAPDWQALIEDDYESVFPLINGNKWNIHYLYQPPFTQQLGVISRKLLTEEVVISFINSIPAKFKFAEINLNTLNKITSGNFKIYDWQNYELDLINSYDNISKNYASNLKRNLKKIENSGLTITKNIKPDEIIELFKTNRGRNIKNLKTEHYHKLKKIAYMGIYKGLIQTYGVYSRHNQLVAGAIFVKSKSKMIFLFSGLSAEGKELHAIAFLLDSFIREHSQFHLTLDFEGSNEPNLARFYKGFGSSLCTYPHIKFNRLPMFIRLGVSIMKRLRQIG
jgi:hypothetical protein